MDRLTLRPYSVLSHDLSDPATMRIVRTPSAYLTRLSSSDIDFIVTYHETAAETSFGNGEFIANIFGQY